MAIKKDFIGIVSVRDNYLDFAKGFLILLVVLFHSSFMGESKEIMIQLEEYVYLFHVQSFFVISGVLVARKVLNGFRVDVYRLLFLYLLFFCLYLFLLWFAHSVLGITHTKNSPPDDVRELLYAIFVAPYGSFWFLYQLIIYTGVAAFMSYCIRQKYKLHAVFIFSLLVVSISPYLFIVKPNMFWFYLLGVFLGALKLNSYKMCKVNISIIAALLISAFTIQLPISMLLAVLFFASFSYLIYLVLNASVGIRTLSWFGSNSLSIFVFHVFPLNLVFLANASLLRIDSSGVLLASVVTIAAVLFSIFMAKSFDYFNISTKILGKNLYVPY